MYIYLQYILVLTPLLINRIPSPFAIVTILRSCSSPFSVETTFSDAASLFGLEVCRFYNKIRCVQI